MKVVITGGAGFIGSAVIREIIENTDFEVINIDKLTYAGNLSSLGESIDSKRYSFYQLDICMRQEILNLFQKENPNIVMNLAAESHVDRSIDSAGEFIHTNIVGTYELLEASRIYYQNSSNKEFIFHHISTDEVYGDLETEDQNAFTEKTPYKPSSPYSASKASSDHLVRAWGKTYNLPIIVTNCSNNYGPYHFPEKLIPLTILNALMGKKLPIYGDGSQIRDWLYVEDHARALIDVATRGKIGNTYNIGGNNELKNIDVVRSICNILNTLITNKPNGIKDFNELITFVEDRPGHDKRYAINFNKIKNEIGWVPKETFNSGITKTINWYIDNQNWWKPILEKNESLNRIGLGELK